MNTKTRTFNRSKNEWNNEQEALNDVVTKSGIIKDQLIANHTYNAFSWKHEAERETGFPIYRVDKSKTEVAEAFADAMDYLQTHEGNLRTEHTELQYVFTKVRG